MSGGNEITFTVSLSKGLANRHRLPLQHVIDVLRELQSGMQDIGKRIQRERGIKAPDGDFGIELLADEQGIVFKKGSVKANAVLTRDVLNGADAVRGFMATMTLLENKKSASIKPADEPIVRRLATIAEIQKRDRVQLEVALRTPARKRSETAVLGEQGIQVIEKLSSAEAKVAGVTIYGRLRELRDRSKKEAGSNHFWGELVTEQGIIWRVQFRSKDEDRVVKLFRKRVELSGDATYYRANTPKIAAKEVTPEKQKNYESAFDELYGLDSDVYGKEDFDSLLSEIRGGA